MLNIVVCLCTAGDVKTFDIGVYGIIRTYDTRSLAREGGRTLLNIYYYHILGDYDVACIV